MSRGWISDDASMTNMQHYVVVQNSLDVAFEGEHTILACKEKISPFLFVALFVKINILFYIFSTAKTIFAGDFIELNWNIFPNIQYQPVFAEQTYNFEFHSITTQCC